MSQVRRILDIFHPSYAQEHEEMTIPGCVCSYCMGAGNVQGLSAEWKDCPKCKGTGTVTAKVVIDWVPGYELKK